MGHPNRFFIMNDFDRPDQEHVVERFSGQKAAYIHPRLRNWNDNNGYFQINEKCTDIEDFGFSIDIYENPDTGVENKAVFCKTRPSVATYYDGRPRHWQGDTNFALILHDVDKVKITKKSVWECEALPNIKIENSGGNIYHVLEDGYEIDLFTDYGEDKNKVVEEWFDLKIILNLIGE